MLWEKAKQYLIRASVKPVTPEHTYNPQHLEAEIILSKQSLFSSIQVFLRLSTNNYTEYSGSICSVLAGWHTYLINPSTREAEVDLYTLQVQGQPLTSIKFQARLDSGGIHL